MGDYKIYKNWKLENIYPGMVNSEELKNDINKLTSLINSIKDKIEMLSNTILRKDLKKIVALVIDFERAKTLLESIETFIGCLRLQDVNDLDAIKYSEYIENIKSDYDDLRIGLENLFIQIKAGIWKDLLKDEKIKPLSFIIEEMKINASHRLSFKEESLVNKLSVYGYHSWFSFYNFLIGNIKAKISENGKDIEYSVGQLNNLMNNPDTEYRHNIFSEWEKVWEQNKTVFANILNNIAGFRIALNKRRKIPSILFEPLRINRVKGDTLDVMWSAVEKTIPFMLKYLKRKAAVFNLEKLSWCDVTAPVELKKMNLLDYNDTASLIIDAFYDNNKDMGAFAEMAFKKRWVEAEDRLGKDPGAYSGDIPKIGESRIFMTFNGAVINRNILAHELGHAYHSFVMRDLPSLLKNYPPSLAEVASIFSEAVVTDYLMKRTKEKHEIIFLLDNRISRAISTYMITYANFLFEKKFYIEKAKNGIVDAEALCKIMETEQKNVFKNILKEYDPYVWASRGHFYLTSIPFYNFPYTFGFMFSNALYMRFKEEGKVFNEKYRKLLRDTGRMPVEDLALKHLGVNLNEEAFWQDSSKTIIDYINKFETLTNDIVRN